MQNEKISERPQSSKAIPVLGILGVAIILIVVMAAFGPGSKFSSGWQYLVSKPSSGQSSQVTRLDQTERSHYASQQEYSTWSRSSCSAAAIASVLNTYSGHHSIHDVLQAEITAQQISPEAGMLNGLESIAKTVNALGYHALPVVGGSDGIITTANGGTPVLVSMSSPDWPKGHIIVVTGGDSTSVQVVDSWTSNRSSMARVDFASQWTGLAAIVKPGVSQ